MKLTTTWVDQTQNQFNVQAVPDDHPASGRLHQMFGEHTFFLGDDGLHIVEPTEETQLGPDAREVVKVARWGDDGRTTLEMQEPELVGVVVATQKNGNTHA